MRLSLTRGALLRGGLASITGVALPRAADAQSRAALHLATLPVEADATAWYALDQEFFLKSGLDVTIDVITSGSAVTAAVVSGAIDIGVSSISSLTSAHVRGLPILALVAGGLYNGALPTSVLAVQSSSPLRTAKDLSGKTVAVQTLGELAQVAIESWIDTNGGDAKSLKFIEMPTSSMADALIGGRVDAAFIAEPYYTQAKPAIRFFAPAYDGVAKRFLITAWLATPEWIARQPATARKFAAAMRAAAVWANQSQNAAASGAILAKYTKISADTVARMQRAEFATQLDPAMLQPAIDVAARFGTIPKAFPARDLVAQL